MKEISFVVRDDSSEDIIAVLKSYGISPAVKKINLEAKHANLYNILKVVCNYRNVDIKGVHSKSRKREFTEPRQLFCYVVKTSYPSLSLLKIGDFLSRDHSTVLHSIAEVHDIIYGKIQNKDARELKFDVDSLLNYINNHL